MSPENINTMRDHARKMQVEKRDGRKEPVSFDKITSRIADLTTGLYDGLDPIRVSQQVIEHLKDDMKTSELDQYAADVCAGMVTVHPDYGRLAARIAVSDLHKNTHDHKSFTATMDILYNHVRDGEHAPLVTKRIKEICDLHGDLINSRIVHKRDYESYKYFGFKVLERSYLLRTYGKVVERPQVMLMRVALGIWDDDLESAFETYDMLSKGLFTHASPTLFNAGTPSGQMCSCFAEGTLVNTKRGPVQIQDVQIGDMVVTHKGRWREVKQVHVNKIGDRKLMVLHVMYSHRYPRVTDNHRFWCITEDDPTPRWIAVGDMVAQKTFIAEPRADDTRHPESRKPLVRESYEPSWVMDGIRYNVVESVRETTEHHENVYTLGVEEDHSYGIEGMVAENCFLDSFTEKEDSIDGIYEMIKGFALVSKHSGGEGVSVSHVRPSGSFIHGNGGTSNGLIPMLRNYNATARYVNQGGKRNGAVAVYLEPWHGDIFEFLELRQEDIAENKRCLDIFTAVWMNDLLMERVEANGTWSLMNPRVCTGLVEAYGDEFKELYEGYERKGMFMRQVKARDLYNEIIRSVIETGTPYVMSKDQCNLKNNQANLGTVRNSNLCVTGDTKVLTDKGHVEIRDLTDKLTKVWNGAEWSDVTPFQTSEGAEIYEVSLSNGSVVRCTAEHKWWVDGVEPSLANDHRRIETTSLKVGQFLTGYVGPDKTPCIYTCVEAVRKTDDTEPTYCLTEPKRHSFIANGVLTGNCSETVMYSEGLEETAVCVLASISLPAFVRVTGVYGSPDFHAEYDYVALEKAVRRIVRNLDRVIDVNEYPTERAKRSNLRHRPLGIGVQGLANVFMRFMVPFESDEAADLDEKIFETIYWAACSESVELAKEDGPYETFQGSPASEGKLQFDLWKKGPLAGDERYNWTALKASIVKHGLRHSLLTALMPTASSSSILGNIPMYQPPKKLMLTRSTLSGTIKVVNVPELVDVLVGMGIWSEDMKNKIIHNRGSIQGLDDDIPAEIQAVFKTAHEVPLKTQMDREALRGRYICQSQSANRHVEHTNFKTVHKIFRHAWKLGLKTWSYYFHTRAATDAAQVTITKKKKEIKHVEEPPEGQTCSLAGGGCCSA